MHTRSRVGVVYLLHFKRPYHHARHYVGFAVDVAARVAKHRAGSGARLMRAVRNAGIGFDVVRTWEGVTRAFERRLKDSHHGVRFCPACSGCGASRRGRPRVSEMQGDARLTGWVIVRPCSDNTNGTRGSGTA